MPIAQSAPRKIVEDFQEEIDKKKERLGQKTSIAFRNELALRHKRDVYKVPRSPSVPERERTHRVICNAP